MTQALAPRDGASLIERVVIGGDLSGLAPAERVEYYRQVCDSVGLNPLTKPFEYLVLDGKMVLYARRDCTDQLRTLKGVSIVKLEKERMEDLYVVTAYATTADGRQDSSVGAVALTKENGEWQQNSNGKRFFKTNGTFAPLTGDALANAIMKAETKAKRRVTLSICGLGFTDESELDTIQNVQAVAPAAVPVREREPEDAPRPTRQRSREELLDRYLHLLEDAIEGGLELDDDEWSVAEDVTVDVLRKKGPALLKLIEDHRATPNTPEQATPVAF